MRAWRRGGWGLALGAIGLLGCVPEATTPLLREDWDRLRADLSRIEQTLQKSQAEIKADLQEADRRTAQTLGEVQRGVAQVGSRLDEIGRNVGQLDRRVDELRGRIDALALQYDVAGPPVPGGAPAARPAGPPGGRAGPPAPVGAAPSPPAPGGSPPATPPAPGGLPGQATDLYQTAYIDYTRGNYNLAIAAFAEFLRLYPDSDLAEKAQYWIGECHFSLARDFQRRGDQARATQAFERAVQEFRRVPIRFPRGDRVPAALYKESLSLLALGQPSLAEARLQFLIDQYPSTEEAAKARDELSRIKK
ncbi:MAG TPA: tetratricopeptide repeat protein [Methylomirabilota bacterium]|nr:tetratricopeptide repeat protein [Methylomirabilota bacterium]